MKHFLRSLVIALVAGTLAASVPFMFANEASALSGADWRAGRIIDDAIFYNPNSMSIDQIQQFLNSKVPFCDNWGTQPHNGTTRRQYGEARGVHFPLTCLKEYHENPTTKENNLEGRGIPAGAMSAAHIIWAAGQQHNINPQTLIVLLQKEQALVTDDWPWPIQFRAATGYGCPDTAPCDAEYYGFYNQVQNAARQFRSYFNNPNSFNHVPFQNNFVRWHPNAACGGSQVFIENRATAGLYNYTPYQPNGTALSNIYGAQNDGCSSYGNRNFWRLFHDWFGSTSIDDPYGWDVIKTANDSREYLAIGNTRRWISSGQLKSDWNLNTKPVRVVTQQQMDGVALLPPLGRLGYYGSRYWYVDGGKKYWLSNDELLKAWGQYNDRWLAVPANVPLSTLPDGGEATYFASSGGSVAMLGNGHRYTITSNHAGRWRANPIALSSSAYGSIPEAAQVTNNVSINGLKFIVDDGRLLDVSHPILQRDFGRNGTTFVPITGNAVIFLRPQQANRLITQSGSPHWNMLLGGERYYVPNGAVPRSWSIDGAPTVLSSALYNELASSGDTISSLVHDSSNDKYYLIDRSRREITGVARSALQNGPTILDMSATYINDFPDGGGISSPIIRGRELGHVYSIMNGELYHIPTQEVLNGLGVPRKYGVTDVGMDAVSGTNSPYRRMGMFVSSSGTNYFLQDGNVFPLGSSAVNDWTNGASVPAYQSPGFSTRFDVNATTRNQLINEAGRGLLMNQGTAYDVGGYLDAFDGANWSALSVLGLPRTNFLTYLIRSTDSSDSRVWLVNNGDKQHIATGDLFNIYSRRNQVSVRSVSPQVLSQFTTTPGTPSILAVSPGGAFKLLEWDGSFHGFADGDTVNHYAQGNTVQQLSASIFDGFTKNVGSVTRLIRDPGGRVFWVEDGEKRWILNGNAMQPYAHVPITQVSYVVTNWLSDGPVIN